MSTSRDSCCLPSVKKQKHDFQVFAFVQCIIKQLLDSVFVISRIIKVSVRVISLSLRLRLITLTLTLIILDITKTSSNNCLLFFVNREVRKFFFVIRGQYYIFTNITLMFTNKYCTSTCTLHVINTFVNYSQRKYLLTSFSADPTISFKFLSESSHCSIILVTIIFPGTDF